MFNRPSDPHIFLLLTVVDFAALLYKHSLVPSERNAKKDAKERSAHGSDAAESKTELTKWVEGAKVEARAKGETKGQTRRTHSPKMLSR